MKTHTAYLSDWKEKKMRIIDRFESQGGKKVSVYEVVKYVIVCVWVDGK